MISILSEVVEFRNGESGQHVLHIGTLTQRLLERLTQKTDKYDLPPETQELIVMASALHDIGKVAIDDKILNKPGRLTPEEFDLMKTHTVVGANMLDHLGRYKNEALVKTAHDICRWHHERWDGRGYPDGLAGDDIPISAQIVSMADVYDALVSKRVYKAAYSPDTAVQMILHGDCGQFNPLLLECLVEIQDVLKAEIVGRENESELAAAETSAEGSRPSLRCHDNERFVGSGLDRSEPVRGGGNLPGRMKPFPYRATINCVIVMILRILLKISSVYGKIRR